MELTLKRILITDDGILGVLICGNSPICLTLEEEWSDNEKGLSCIPAASYICKRVVTPLHGETFEVMNVEGRDAILFHSGNTEEDTQGCIITGKEYGYLTVKDEESGVMRSKIAVLQSKKGFEEFMEAVSGKMTFALHIKVC